MLSRRMGPYHIALRRMVCFSSRGANVPGRNKHAEPVPRATNDTAVTDRSLSDPLSWPTTRRKTGIVRGHKRLVVPPDQQTRCSASPAAYPGGKLNKKETILDMISPCPHLAQYKDEGGRVKHVVASTFSACCIALLC